MTKQAKNIFWKNATRIIFIHHFYHKWTPLTGMNFKWNEHKEFLKQQIISMPFVSFKVHRKYTGILYCLKKRGSKKVFINNLNTVLHNTVFSSNSKNLNAFKRLVKSNQIFTGVQKETQNRTRQRSSALQGKLW